MLFTLAALRLFQLDPTVRIHQRGNFTTPGRAVRRAPVRRNGSPILSLRNDLRAVLFPWLAFVIASGGTAAVSHWSISCAASKGAESANLAGPW
ncbi:hypothetical protein [Amycolatopsis solani]|uniref:hypothetical protein n=1 Tax=Amycolatopsis solani TaxID=3028615 RepID=UPI0025B0F70D|nr:hypothetical protein [Amycolatopsis sp. MEP2-6]